LPRLRRGVARRRGAVGARLRAGGQLGPGAGVRASDRVAALPAGRLSQGATVGARAVLVDAPAVAADAAADPGESRHVERQQDDRRDCPPAGRRRAGGGGIVPPGGRPLPRSSRTVSLLTAVRLPGPRAVDAAATDPLQSPPGFSGPQNPGLTAHPPTIQ